MDPRRDPDLSILPDEKLTTNLMLNTGKTSAGMLLPLVLVLGSSLQGDVLKGPYLLEMSSTSVRIRCEANALLETEVRCWREDEPGTVTVTPAAPERLRVQIKVVSSDDAKKTLKIEKDHYLYDVRLTGLRP